MEKQIFPTLKGKELIEMLDANSDAVENLDYSVKLYQHEIAELKTNFAQKSIEESRLQDELKDIKSEYKVKLKPIQEDKTFILSQIKTGSRSEFGKCYKLVDHEEGLTGYYNNRGQLVYSRPANEEERGQRTVHMEIRKSGTND